MYMFMYMHDKGKNHLGGMIEILKILSGVGFEPTPT